MSVRYYVPRTIAQEAKLVGLGALAIVTAPVWAPVVFVFTVLRCIGEAVVLGYEMAKLPKCSRPPGIDPLYPPE